MPAAPVFGLPTTMLSQLGTITVDTVIREQHIFENLVTKHPIEDGSPRSDHIVNLPLRLEMDGRITDTPSSFVLAAASGAAGLLGAQLGIDPAAVAAGTSLIGASLPGRAKTAFEELVALYALRETFTVISGMRDYVNMTFQTLSFPRTAADGRSIRFNATLVEILVVGTSPTSNAERILAEVHNTALDIDNLGSQAMEFAGFG